jgi:hypothetical protein
MADPKLIDADGWRVYPATSRFDKSDSIGYGGTKAFEIPMVAQVPQKQTPVAQFSYFDPDKGKYFTLTTKPLVIDAAASPSVTPSGVAAAAASATPTPEPEGQWLTHSKARSWQPVLRWPGFWLLNGGAAIVLMAITALMAVRRSRHGIAGQRAALRKERDRLISGLGRASLPDDSFFSQALGALTIQASLDNEAGPFELIRALEGRGKNVSDLQILLARADEMKFSGGANPAPRLEPDERGRIIVSLKEVCR